MAKFFFNIKNFSIAKKNFFIVIYLHHKLLHNLLWFLTNQSQVYLLSFCFSLYHLIFHTQHEVVPEPFFRYHVQPYFLQLFFTKRNIFPIPCLCCELLDAFFFFHWELDFLCMVFHGEYFSANLLLSFVYSAQEKFYRLVK